jgi:tRNA (adenine57-N1/adenine58-N1)-methyltransferase
MSPRRGPLRAGERVRLTGPRGRINTVTLEVGGAFHTHRGFLSHDEIIGGPDSRVLTASTGDEYLVQRPLLKDYVLSMPRGAAIVYPKDAAQILQLADVFPGATVVEAGVGSGALTLWLLRTLGADGVLHSVERREEFAQVAEANVRGFLGEAPSNWHLRLGSVQDELAAIAAPGEVDRVILDMLAPWECIDAAATALAPGGVLLAYVATVTQLSRTAEAIRDTAEFDEPESSETLVRTWHVEGLAVRPDHRMTGHTGFLIVARRLAPGSKPLEKKRRASKDEFTDDDVQAWTPGSIGERERSPKRARKAVRQAIAVADAAVDAARADGTGEVE